MKWDAGPNPSRGTWDCHSGGWSPDLADRPCCGVMALYIITLGRLSRATSDVTTQLDALGFYDEPVRQTEVYLVPFGVAFGWQYYGTTGEICIPAVSLARLGALLNRPCIPLRDVLRHEFAHAVADTHRGLIRSKRFRQAFGGSHDTVEASDYNPNRHVTRYAATCPAEDFAEVFMYYVKHKGRLPSRYNTTPIKRKWRFIDELRKKIAAGKRKW